MTLTDWHSWGFCCPSCHAFASQEDMSSLQAQLGVQEPCCIRNISVCADGIWSAKLLNSVMHHS